MMNKLKFILASMLLPLALQAMADEVSVSDIEVTPGESAEIVINFSATATNLTGYQMSLYLPEGVSLQKDEDDEYLYELSGRHNKNHVFSVNDQSDGGLMLVCYSMTKKTIAAGDGELLRLPVDVSATATGTLSAQLRTVKFSDTNSNVSQLDNVTFNFILATEPEKTEQTLAITELPAMTYGDATYTLPSKTEQELAIAWQSSNESVATVSGNILTITGAGTAILTAIQAGSDEYLPFEGTLELTVGKASLVITANDCLRRQGESNPELTVSYDGFVNGDDVSSLTKAPAVTTTATADSPVGDYAITVSDAETSNYVITYINGTLTVISADAPVEVTDVSQMTDAIYIEPFDARLGDEVDIEVRLKNAADATSYGFELELPDGIEIATDGSGAFDDAVTLSTRNSKHSVTTNRLANGTYKLGVASLSSKTLTGNDGVVLTIKASVAETMAVGVYPVVVRSPLIVYGDGTKPTVQQTQTAVTVEDYQNGDVDGDDVVDLADAVLVINYYVGKPVTTFVYKAADVDGDGVIDLADAVLIINYYVGKIPSLSRGEVNDELEAE